MSSLAWRWLRRLGAPCLALALAAAPVLVLAEEAPQLERRVKAVFLYKFVDYVVWPAGTFSQPDAPLLIGVMGDDRLAEDLAAALSTRSVGGRPIGVRRYHEGEPLGGMHMLFVARGESARLASLAKAAAANGQPLLLVSENEDALERGSIINFVVSGGRVRFDIALDTAEARGLKLSSGLLGVARKLRPGSAP